MTKQQRIDFWKRQETEALAEFEQSETRADREFWLEQAAGDRLEAISIEEQVKP